MIPSKSALLGRGEGGHTVAFGVLAEADARIRPKRLGEETSSFLEGLGEKRAPIEEQKVEDHVQERGRASGVRNSALDAGLEAGEVGFARFVHGNDLTVDDCLPGCDPRRRLQEGPEVPSRIQTASRQSSDSAFIDDGLDPEPVPLHLEQPFGVIEWRGHEGGVHGRDEVRAHDRRCYRSATRPAHDQRGMGKLAGTSSAEAWYFAIDTVVAQAK